MNYKIDTSKPKQHIIKISYEFTAQQDGALELQLPAWRPGRYELANFAKNILELTCHNGQNEKVDIQKVTKEKWRIDKAKMGEIFFVHYAYYAHQMDAGGSWLDDEQIYINPINCLLYIPGREHEPCDLHLNLPENYSIACGINPENNTLKAENFYHLVDSPLIASNSLIHKTYTVKDITFHIWVQGECSPPWPKILEDFRSFTEVQIETMGSFPENDYHFIYQILPYKHYHGVEHRNSTIITLGPSEDFTEESFYNNFLGISSHELFHSWNVCKIRPVEMMPYEFSGENYFRTGYIAEGVTTYYGDLFLKRANVFSFQQYLQELNKLLKRHSYHYSRAALGLTDSSFDLWVDGYTPGIPDRKVSIYEKGALMALFLDLKIRKDTNGTKSLDNVLKYLWEEFGKKGKGYSEEDYKSASEEVAGGNLNNYFLKFISGKEAFEEELGELLNFCGLQLLKTQSESKIEKYLGIKTVSESGKTVIDLIHPQSQAAELFSIGDQLIAVNGRKVLNNTDKLINKHTKNSFFFFRQNKLMEGELSPVSEDFFAWYSIKKISKPDTLQENNLVKWLGKI